MTQEAEPQMCAKSWEVMEGLSSTALMMTNYTQLIPGTTSQGFATSWRNLNQCKAWPFKLNLRLAL